MVADRGNLVHIFAYQEMMEMARRQSKCTEIIKTYDPEKFQIQGYLKSNKFTREYQQVLFALRTKSYPLKIYFRHQFKDMVCRICLQRNTVEDLQQTICCEELGKYYFDDQLNINHIIVVFPSIISS